MTPSAALERCRAVTERAEMGPCEKWMTRYADGTEDLCGFEANEGDWCHDPDIPSSHPYLGPVTKVCGHEESEHHADEIEPVCNECFSTNVPEPPDFNVDFCFHALEPSKDCPTCGGTSYGRNACTDPCDNPNGPCACGAWHSEDSPPPPCPAGCRLGRVAA